MATMNHAGKIQNEYQRTLGDLFNDIPKAVLAAIAVSALTCGGDHLDTAKERVCREWLILYQNGIIPQKPNGEAMALAAVELED